MARKTEEVVIEAEGRDKGKVFLLTEMSATRAEEWGSRFLLSMTRAGVDVPDDFLDRGMAGVAMLALRAVGGLTWGDSKPLLDEMFTCVKIIPDPTRKSVVRELIEDDIEEVSTRIHLRERIITLHTGFSIADAISKYRQAPATDGIMQTTSTSP